MYHLYTTDYRLNQMLEHVQYVCTTNNKSDDIN